MARTKRVAVILSGCGVFDGSEIHEATLSLLALDQHGAVAIVVAPDVAQAIVAGLELGEIICVPGLEEIGTFEQLRDVQQATLFGGNSGKLATRYRR